MNRTLTASLSLKCRSVRIGSYKFEPADVIQIKQQDHIKIDVPLFEGNFVFYFCCERKREIGLGGLSSLL